ncbi:hypothetical protein EYF80_037451 [Liparis tanakae]|uniref:Uncharacterized protein n=1 Tax=Liparis tanakae TaxID=230148 RepID=A0A4Z2GFR1_9TELE|nr:hypothetical protein EYF80_037451 [Liparis tanakae]
MDENWVQKSLHSWPLVEASGGLWWDAGVAAGEFMATVSAFSRSVASLWSSFSSPSKVRSNQRSTASSTSAAVAASVSTSASWLASNRSAICFTRPSTGAPAAAGQQPPWWPRREKRWKKAWAQSGQRWGRSRPLCSRRCSLRWMYWRVGQRFVAGAVARGVFALHRSQAQIHGFLEPGGRRLGRSVLGVGLGEGGELRGGRRASRRRHVRFQFFQTSLRRRRVGEGHRQQSRRADGRVREAVGGQHPGEGRRVGREEEARVVRSVGGEERVAGLEGSGWGVNGVRGNAFPVEAVEVEGEIPVLGCQRRMRIR